MENVIDSNGLLALSQAMTNEFLVNFKAQNVGNKTIEGLVDSILKGREAEALKANIKIQFEKAISGMVEGYTQTFDKPVKAFNVSGLPQPPEGIINVYIAWKDVEVEDQSKPKEKVTIIDTPAITDKEGKITTQAITHIEERYPKTIVKKWVVETNKATSGSGSKAQTEGKTTGKRSIKLFKRNGITLELKGDYPNASEACKALKLEVGSDSAKRVLEREGYIVEALS